jgi:CelD/BcsL family acetyltransferase involved in cellulose biosynthesis
MNIRTVSFQQLTSDEIRAWSEIQRAEPALASPYFRPEFTEAVAAVRGDVEVAVLSSGGRLAAFFPYQRTRRNIGQAVGGMLSDFHGLISRANISCDPLEILRACGLKAWHFDHLICDQKFFAPFVWRERESPYISLTHGFEHYLANKDNGRRLLAEYRKKMGRLVRETGPLRYQDLDWDQNIFSTLVSWKSDQYRRTKLPNVFDFAWVRNLMDKISQYKSDDFSPALSVLYAGDTPAAITFGMRCRGVLHVWFPAYNVELAQRSPGLLHWIEMIKATEAAGIQRIDLGEGPEKYKERLSNGISRVAQGTVDVKPATNIVRRAWRSAGDHVRATPLAAPARASLRMIRQVRHWLDVRKPIRNQNP